MRRSGVATRLVGQVEEQLHQRGCDKIQLQVRSESEDIVEFYEHLGYETESHVSMGKILGASQ